MSEEILRTIVSHFVLLTEAGAAIVIFSGAVIGFVRYVYYCLIRYELDSFSRVRLQLGKFLALGLEFQLASDLLRTAVAPSFDGIAKLAAVAAIRTALNYFLSKEIQNEKEESSHV